MCARKCTKTQGVCVKQIPSQSDQTEYNYCLTDFAGFDGEGSWGRRGPQCDVQMKLASANAAATIRRDSAVKHGVLPKSHRALEPYSLPRGPMIFRGSSFPKSERTQVFTGFLRCFRKVSARFPQVFRNARVQRHLHEPAWTSVRTHRHPPAHVHVFLGFCNPRIVC